MFLGHVLDRDGHEFAELLGVIEHAAGGQGVNVDLDDVVVADDEITTERVSIGTIVKVKDLDDGGETYEYAIVGANEADPTADKISNESPVGAGLLGAKKNQTVTITIPAGILRYKVLSIKKL